MDVKLMESRGRTEVKSQFMRRACGAEHGGEAGSQGQLPLGD